MITDIIIKPDDFRKWMSCCKSIFAFDCEASSLNWLDLEIIGFSICDGQQACYVDIKQKYKKEILTILNYYLQEAKMVIMHNAPYDMVVLKKEGIEI